MQKGDTVVLKGGLAALALGVTVFAASQSLAAPVQIEISSSLNPVGSGARATGMGGAFIAVADDATAASWNPAGLVHLEKPEFSIVYNYDSRSQKYHSGGANGLDGATNSYDMNDINYASIAYPFQLFNMNMIVTMNYQRLYDMNKKYTINYNWPGMDPGDSLNSKISFSQSGGLSPLSPAFALQVTPNLYFGATVNIWDDFTGMNSWKSSYSDNSTGVMSSIPVARSNTKDEKYVFSGLNANLGLLYSVKGKYTVGAVYKTPFDADVQRTSIFNGATSTENFTMSMPASFGAGFSYRYSDSLSVALDLYRTQWSQFKLTSKGVEYNPLTSERMASGGKGKDTTQIRLGGEYLIIGDKMTIPVRGGLFYDPQPGVRLKGEDASGNNVYSSIIDDFFGVSLGSGIAIGSYAFDVSYQYRWGNRTTGDAPYTGTTADISQHTVMTSLIYHF